MNKSTYLRDQIEKELSLLHVRGFLSDGELDEALPIVHSGTDACVKRLLPKKLCLRSNSYALNAVIRCLIASDKRNLEVVDELIVEMASSGEWGMVRSLLHFGTSTNILSNEGRSPLSYAVSAREFDLIEDFLANGADPRLKDIAGKDPVTIAEECELYSLAKRLADHNPGTIETIVRILRERGAK